MGKLGKWTALSDFKLIFPLHCFCLLLGKKTKTKTKQSLSAFLESNCQISLSQNKSTYGLSETECITWFAFLSKPCNLRSKPTIHDPYTTYLTLCLSNRNISTKHWGEPFFLVTHFTKFLRQTSGTF